MKLAYVLKEISEDKIKNFCARLGAHYKKFDRQ